MVVDPRRSFRSRALVGVALLVGMVHLHAAEAAPGPQALQPIPGPKSDAEMQAARAAYQAKHKAWEDQLTFELVGIGRAAGVPVGLIAVNGNLCAVMPGLTLGGREVSEIDVDNQRVTLSRRDQSSTVLVLTSTNPIKIPELSERQVEFLLSKESIKRTNAFHGMPIELHSIWGKVTREGQAQVLSGYLQRGLVVGALESEGYAAKLLQRQISERVKEKREAFVASPTPEQKAAFTAPQAAIRFTDPSAAREKQAAVAKSTQTRRDEVLANLTPEQRALYDEYQSWLGT